MAHTNIWTRMQVQGRQNRSLLKTTQVLGLLAPHRHPEIFAYTCQEKLILSRHVGAPGSGPGTRDRGGVCFLVIFGVLVPLLSIVISLGTFDLDEEKLIEISAVLCDWLSLIWMISLICIFLGHYSSSTVWAKLGISFRKRKYSTVQIQLCTVICLVS